MDHEPVFKSLERKAQFHAELLSVIEKYPEIMETWTDAWQNDVTSWDELVPFRPGTPKFVSGQVLLLQVSNLDHYSSVVVLEPHDQNCYMTKGMVEAAAEMV
jgi:hypothetical protein